MFVRGLSSGKCFICSRRRIIPFLTTHQGSPWVFFITPALHDVAWIRSPSMREMKFPRYGKLPAKFAYLSGNGYRFSLLVMGEQSEHALRDESSIFLFDFVYLRWKSHALDHRI